MPSNSTLSLPKKAGNPAAAKGPNQNKPRYRASVGQPEHAKKLAAALSKR
jgi:hypothetical protein